MHQIRVHAHHVGLPIAGDPQYVSSLDGSPPLKYARPRARSALSTRTSRGPCPPSRLSFSQLGHDFAASVGTA
eukprot:4530769-Pleurochrysis_carterae.AAC.1